MSKGIMFIDGKRVAFDGEKNVLSVIRKAGIEIPTFCYYSELSVYGACRMCVVENEWGGIEASCSMQPKDGMKIRTNTARLQKHRKMILELLLAAHCRDCTVCEKNGKCKLQTLSLQYGIRNIRFEDTREQMEIDRSSPSIMRDPNKCILCGDCVRVCDEVQGMGIIDFAHRGSDLQIMPAFGKKIGETDCVSCGQCAAVCPTGAITIKGDIGRVWRAIQDPKKRVIVQVAPAVRVAIGEEFGMEPGENVMGKLVAALKMMGVDEVFDTTLGADLTVMEEASEFLKRLENGGPFPMFTSCCPAWVRYVENRAPQYLPNISTCKSPMEMFGATLKAHFKSMEAVDGKEAVVVAIMPCTAKKFEAQRDEFKRDGLSDIDYVITTQEISTMIKENGIVFKEIEFESTDMPFGMGSGAGLIFGATGGVTEAVIRRCAEQKDTDMLRAIEYSGVRGMDSVKEATVQVEGKDLKFAVVNGLGNAQKLLKKVEAGEVSYDLIEVMACPGGCIGGAGQPSGNSEKRRERAQGLYASDQISQIKRSEENPMIMALYNGVLKKNRHELLHVHYGQD